MLLYLLLLSFSIIFTHPDIVLNKIRPDPGNCSGRIAAVSRRPRDRSAWPGRAALVTRDKPSLDLIFHNWTKWPDALRLRTVSRRSWGIWLHPLGHCQSIRSRATSPNVKRTELLPHPAWLLYLHFEMKKLFTKIYFAQKQQFRVWWLLQSAG